MDVKHVIKKYRKIAGMTQTKLGEKLDVGLSTIARYESGEITPPIDKINQMTELFGIDFLLESMGMELTFPYEATFNYQLINELSLIYSALDTDDVEKQYSEIVTEGMKKYVVTDADIKEFCNRSKEYLKIAFKHFLIDKGVYQGIYHEDEEQENNGREEEQAEPSDD